MNNYVDKMRLKLGKQMFIHPGARIIMENDVGAILIIERTDNHNIGLPAGALENGETIKECIIREVKEETGLNIISLEVIGISTSPELEKVEYPNGDRIQYFTVEFYSNDWTGDLKTNDPKEVKGLKFVTKEKLRALPDNEKSALESLAFYQRNGKIMLR